MAKGQKKSTREIRKPKADKAAKGGAAPAAGGVMGKGVNPLGGASGKKS